MFLFLQTDVEKTKNKVNKWIVIDKIVYDVQGFTAQHPGGPGFLHSAIGSEVTAAFNGGIYYHSNAARNLMAGMRIAKIDKVPANAVESEE